MVRPNAPSPPPQYAIEQWTTACCRQVRQNIQKKPKQHFSQTFHQTNNTYAVYSVKAFIMILVPTVQYWVAVRRNRYTMRVSRKAATAVTGSSSHRETVTWSAVQRPRSRRCWADTVTDNTETTTSPWTPVSLQLNLIDILLVKNEHVWPRRPTRYVTFSCGISCPWHVAVILGLLLPCETDVPNKTVRLPVSFFGAFAR